MFDLLMLPGAPFFLASLAGVLLALLGLRQLGQRRLAVEGVRRAVSSQGVAGRVALGHMAAVPVGGALLLLGFAMGAGGTLMGLLAAAALCLYLYLGWIVPRKPLVAAQKEAQALRLLTPGFVSFVRVSLVGYDAPAIVLERYVARPDRRKAPLQALVREALTLVHERRMRPMAALQLVVREHQCVELRDVAEALAQAESDGSSVEAALAAHERTLLAILDDEFKRMLKRRTMYLLVLVALSLVIGILGNLLWVMVGGALLG